ncbi:MAG TPA: hypothetical protein VE914_07230 [Candidatus Angelobacter sp.]|nr:hypothetical protein [Candidatus Angelobacter sp.]
MSIKAKAGAFVAWLQRWWDRVRTVGAVVEPVRFSLIAVVIGAIVFWGVDQGRETLRLVQEDVAAVPLHALLFLISLLFWAFNVWYWARVVLYLDVVKPTSQTQHLVHCLTTLIPRVLGTIPFGIVALGFILDAGVNTGRAWALAAATAVLGALFCAFLVYRRKLFKLPQADHLSLTDIFALSWLTRAALAALLVCGGGAFALGWAVPQAFQYLGPAGVLLLGIGTWVPIGTLVAYWGSRYRLPVLTFLLLLAFVFGVWNDNHAVRVDEESAAAFTDTKEGTKDPRLSLADFLDAWYCAPTPQKRNCPRDATNPRPLIIVATAGGASRAAEWTVTVLGRLEAEIPGFSDNVVAISGVSGGSLGAAVYRATLLESRDPTLVSCRRSPDEDATPTMTACMQKVLSEDYLSPTIAAFLYPDLVQRFSPVPCKYLPDLCLPDRARAIEQSWEAAWSRVFVAKDDAFARSFNAQLAADAKPWPALLLNGTQVETGQRIITSSVRLDDNFKDAIDLFAVVDADVPFSTAVNFSARFPYVEPAGTVRQIQGERSVAWGHIVDGGYFENFGAITAAEVLQAARATFKDSVIPIVIQISADPDLKVPSARISDQDKTIFCDDAQAGCEDAKPLAAFRELLSPVITLANTRTARGVQAAQTLETLVEDGVYLHFNMPRDPEDDYEPPLGWAMSQRALDWIGTRLMKTKENTERVEALKACLSAAPADRQTKCRGIDK